MQNGARKHQRKTKTREARKTALQVASLNLNGFGNLISGHEDNKWGKIYRMMSEHRIGVLLLQETHLTTERVAAIHKMFAKKIKVLFSANEDAPTQREGVAIVLNAKYVNTKGVTATTVVPGRAIQAAIPCQGGDSKVILCVYAPTSNGAAERKLFFNQVLEYYETHPDCPRPELMAGDFNTIEDAIDRLPINSSHDQSVMPLDDLKISLGLMLADGWRVTHPNTRDFTFHRGIGPNATFSRLDRIYVTPAVFDTAREWRICEAGVKTDHSLILVQLTPANAPEVGQGRPLFPLQLLKDAKLAKALKARGLEAMRELTLACAAETRSDEINPQRILYRFKVDAMKMARVREREVIPKLLAEIKEYEQALKAVKANRDLPQDVILAESEALTKQIRQLKQRRYNQQQQNSRATYRLYGDRPTKYWSKLHRECAPRDIINSFEKEGLVGVSGEKVYESDSARMAEMARTHHVNVQKDDPGAKLAHERELDIAAALSSLDAKVTSDQAAALEGDITYEECVSALRAAKCGTAPGLDGIPSELWKTLHARYTEDLRFPERPNFDVVRLLTAALEDIRIHGVHARTPFAEGWIAPIYKEKGERTRVVNYRPITLLNTDYKLLTKILAVRLAEVAPHIIHPAQAGFVPGRRIQNHTQLARMMMCWAEEKEENGAIIALDQEKAYDKVAHDYLWRVLEKCGVPATFIRLVQSLYKNAMTVIMINGIFSRPYRIHRGVRQGDPLSCLLFDLAIEPLSAMIRKSDIEGFCIPRNNEILKAVLFADDTTVYLSSRDDFATLQRVLDTWCSAAKARFNIRKTEIIPIGTPAFRAEMATTYQTTGAWRNYPQGVHIAQSGEAVRILGAFFGNEIEQVDVWTLILTKIVAMRKPLMHAIERWKTGHATMQGKKHVVQMIIGGMTQFMTTVQRMPVEIQARLNKLIRNYLWNDRHSPPVALEYVCLPIERGGLEMLDLEARSEAIDIMWLKAYLSFSKDRPTWAFLADDILAAHVPKNCRVKASELRLNPFLQDWKPKVRGLPSELQGMMDVARKYGVRLEALALSREILLSMPMWDHAHADKTRLSRLTMPSKLLTCLQYNHRVRIVGDFVRLAALTEGHEHRPTASCRCTGCVQLRTDVGCESPHLCSRRAKDMISTLPSKWDPYQTQPEDYELEEAEKLSRERLAEGLVPFDRRITTRGNLGEALRIFTDQKPTWNGSVSMRTDEDGSSMTMATDGSCIRNGEKDACAGAGVFVCSDSSLNQSIRLPTKLDQSNQTGEIVAVLLAAQAAQPSTRVTLVTDSQTTMDAITKWKQRQEDTGYILQRNAMLTRSTIARLRMRRAHTLFQWTKGHAGHLGNEAADRLAARGAEKRTEDQICLDIPSEYSISGAKLQAMTQKLAYRAIRARKDIAVDPRPRTVANLDRVSSGVLAAFGTQLHDATIWRSLRSKHISRAISQFMWMTLHDAYMIGTHWLRPNMPEELRTRAICAVCGECESMTHILFECNAKGQEKIWGLLRQTWLLTGSEWKEPTWGTTLGAACAIFKTRSGCRKSATEQLWTIICSEATYLIWKLRCERVIQREGTELTDCEITNRYFSTLDARLNLDRRTAAQARGKKSLKPGDVMQIWSPIIEDVTSLPPEWVTKCGVLVGIKRGR